VTIRVVFDNIPHWRARVVLVDSQQLWIVSGIWWLQVVDGLQLCQKAACPLIGAFLVLACAVEVAILLHPGHPPIVKFYVQVVVDESIGVDPIAAPPTDHYAGNRVDDRVAICVAGKHAANEQRHVSSQVCVAGRQADTFGAWECMKLAQG
jgi:hypothetical protein